MIEHQGFGQTPREITLNDRTNYVHLLSGGLDSAYSIFETVKRLKKVGESFVVHPIFFDYGHYASDCEWEKVIGIVEFIRAFLNDKSVIDDPVKISLKSDLFQWCKSQAFKGISGEEKPEIQNRNMILFSVLASYLIACAENQNIRKTKFQVTSGFKEKELPDSKSTFFNKFTELLSIYRPEFTFHFHILNSMERQTVIRKTKDLLSGNEIELKKLLALTISCYSPTKDCHRCGLCYKCKNLDKEKTTSS